MKQILWKINTLVTNMEKIIVGTGVLAATFLIFYNVILRQFSARSLAWAEELTRYIMIWVTFFGANLCIQNNVHVIHTYPSDCPFGTDQFFYALAENVAGKYLHSDFCGDRNERLYMASGPEHFGQGKDH